MYNTCADRGSWLKKTSRPWCFLQGAGFVGQWPTSLSLSLCILSCLPFVRSSPYVVRSVPLAVTGSRPSDAPRTPINIDRASRDLAYFFYHLPVERVAWAFPYAPPGLYTQLYIYIYTNFILTIPSTFSLRSTACSCNPDD